MDRSGSRARRRGRRANVPSGTRPVASRTTPKTPRVWLRCVQASAGVSVAGMLVMIGVMMVIGAPVVPLQSQRGFSAAVVELTHVRSAADVGSIVGIPLQQDGSTQRWASRDESVSEAQYRSAVETIGKLLRVNTLDVLLMTGYTVTTCGLATMLAMLAAVPVARSADGNPQRRAVAACKVVTSDRLLMACLLGIVVAVVLDGMETIIGSTLLQRFAAPAIARAWARHHGMSNGASVASNGTHEAGVALGGMPGCEAWPEACRAVTGSSAPTTSPPAGLFSWQFVAGRVRSVAFAVGWGALGVRLLFAASARGEPMGSGTVSKRVKRCGWTVEWASGGLRWACGAVSVLGACMLLVAGAAPMLVELDALTGWRATGRGTEVLAEGGILLCSLGMLGSSLAALWVAWLCWRAISDKTEGPTLADAV